MGVLTKRRKWNSTNRDEWQGRWDEFGFFHHDDGTITDDWGIPFEGKKPREVWPRDEFKAFVRRFTEAQQKGEAMGGSIDRRWTQRALEIVEELEKDDYRPKELDREDTELLCKTFVQLAHLVKLMGEQLADANRYDAEKTEKIRSILNGEDA
jgi:hypothetical protein